MIKLSTSKTIPIKKAITILGVMVLRNVTPIDHITYDDIFSVISIPSWEPPEFVSTHRFYITGFNEDSETLVLTTTSMLNPIVIAIPFKKVESELIKYQLDIPVEIVE